MEELKKEKLDLLEDIPERVVFEDDINSGELEPIQTITLSGTEKWIDKQIKKLAKDIDLKVEGII